MSVAEKGLMTPERIALLRKMLDRVGDKSTMAVRKAELVDLLDTAEREARLREAATKAEAVMSRNIYPQPDKPHSDWAVLRRLREALEAKGGE